MQACTNHSLQYINYPAKTLFKSARVLATISVGALVLKRTYPLSQYVTCGLMVMGLALFTLADFSSSPYFDIRGVFLILIALLADACLLFVQESVLQVGGFLFDIYRLFVFFFHGRL